MCYTTYDGTYIDYGEDDEREDYSEPTEPCPECLEPALDSWDHLPTCEWFKPMQDLPF